MHRCAARVVSAVSADEEAEDGALALTSVEYRAELLYQRRCLDSLGDDGIIENRPIGSKLWNAPARTCVRDVSSVTMRLSIGIGLTQTNESEEPLPAFAVGSER